MTAPVATIDFDAVYEEITARQKREKERRIRRPLIRIWDGDWNLRGVCKKEISAEFQFLDNETGIGTLEMPLDYYLSKWMNDVKARDTTNIHITVDKDGARWSGRMEELRVIQDDNFKTYIRATFKHDYEELKHILCWVHPPLKSLRWRSKWGVGLHRSNGQIRFCLRKYNFQRCGRSMAERGGYAKRPFFVILCGLKVPCGCCRIIHSICLSGSISISQPGQWLLNLIRMLIRVFGR